MEKRMNKEELLELLKTIKVDKSEFWLLSTAALVLRNLYPDAADLDIAVTDKGLEQIKQNYCVVSKGNDWYKVTEKIECVCDGPKEKLEYQPEKVGDYYLQNMEEYYKFLLSSTREKDIKKLKVVKEYRDNLIER